MQLSELGYTGKKEEKLNKKGIYTGDALLYSSPKRYLYFDHVYPLEYQNETYRKIQDKEPIAIIGKVVKVVEEYKSNLNRSLIKIRVEDSLSDNMLFVNFLGFHHMMSYYNSCIEQNVIIGGKLQYNTDFKCFSMLNPDIFSRDIEKYNRIIPVYSKYKGISEEYYEKSIEKGIELLDEDYLPERFVRSYNLFTRNEAVKFLHYPHSMDSIKRAKQRITFDSLLYFALSLEQKREATLGKSDYRIINKSITEEMISKLPYTLTEGQETAIKDMINTAHRGEKISALIQGDVGSGKTIVAASMMFAIAENGYQAVLMAPTAVLAEQHYETIKELAEDSSFTVKLVTNKIKSAELKGTLADIASGKANLIIGTHSCISKNVTYHNLALVITDEEHKFGVAQREELALKAKEGAHTITMSGTPIPRTLANTLYGDSVKVYSLKPPAERQPIQTAVCNSDKPVFNWIEKEVGMGHQCYVVCPLIEEADEESTIAGRISIEETKTKYEAYFAPKGIRCAVITGKTPKEEQSAVMEAFKNNEIHILIATTVIEVGVNNPNATVMVIQSAEMFGLATLHQLRGRVGRGKLKSYCILQRTPGYEGGSNLDILCRETDGLEIAKEDLKNRGMGNLIGMEQSGKNNFVELMLAYPNMFERIKGIAREMMAGNPYDHMVDTYMTTYEEKFLNAPD